jgi:hypothetical protein
MRRKKRRKVMWQRKRRQHRVIVVARKQKSGTEVGEETKAFVLSVLKLFLLFSFYLSVSCHLTSAVFLDEIPGLHC